MSLKGLLTVLVSRTILFAIFQSVVALLLRSWNESIKFWMLTATLTNFVSIALLVMLFKREGRSYMSMFHLRKEEWKRDLSAFSVLGLISVLLVMVTPYLLQYLLLGDATYSQKYLLQPLPAYLVYFLLIAFPVSVAYAELATYFGYIMPRLKRQSHSSWLVVILPVFFLSIQHCTLPLVFDLKFLLFRGLSYLPFALLLGLSLYKRPALLPYFAILHGLLDALAVAMYLFEP